MAQRDYYEVLGLQKGASIKDIKAAYYAVCIYDWHLKKWCLLL